MMVIEQLEVPLVQAPLAGGPSTVELAVAVSEAGGLGFLAGGYTTPEALRESIASKIGGWGAGAPSYVASVCPPSTRSVWPVM